MKKISEIRKLIKNVKSNKRRFDIYFSIFIMLFEFPAFVFHEIMHLIVAVPFGKNLKVTEFYFFVIEGTMLKSYSLGIQYSSNSTIGIVGASAPLIGWFIAVVSLIITGHWIILMYFFIGIKMFYLSINDIKCLESNNLNKTVCNILLNIHYLIWQKEKTKKREFDYSINDTVEDTSFTKIIRNKTPYYKYHGDY